MTHQKTKAFTQRSRLASLPSRIAAFTVMSAVSLFAQAPAAAPVRPTLAEAQALLKAHPDLQAGFKTAELASVTVAEAISGGFVFRYQSLTGYTGVTTIVGPTTVIVDKGWLGGLFDKLVSVAKEFLGGAVEGTGGGTNNNNGCVNINVNGSGNSVTVGNVTCSPK
jgi:hypothetical protein